jgi:subtilisin family serine protease
MRRQIWGVLFGTACLLTQGTLSAADLSQSDRDFDVDFEADDILALNMSAAGRAAARSLGFRSRETEPLRNLRLSMTRLRPPPAMNARRALERLRRADPRGIYSLNEHYALAGAIARCDVARCYGAPLVGLGDDCRVTVRIGMVDSAVERRAPNLKDREVTVKRFSSTAATDPEKRHGSAIAALMVGGPDEGPVGLVPKASLFAADVFSVDQDDAIATDAARIAAALDWLAGAKVVAINLSFEGPDSKVLEVIARRLIDDGTTLIAAAGNQGPSAPPAFPGSYPGVIAVTAVDRYRDVWPQANAGDYVALAAPGVAIWTTDHAGMGIVLDGTSFAAPFVTAAVARMLSFAPELRPDEVSGRLRQEAIDLGRRGPDPVFGAGLLQAPPCRESRVRE